MGWGVGGGQSSRKYYLVQNRSIKVLEPIVSVFLPLHIRTSRRRGVLTWCPSPCWMRGPRLKAVRLSGMRCVLYLQMDTRWSHWTKSRVGYQTVPAECLAFIIVINFCFLCTISCTIITNFIRFKLLRHWLRNPMVPSMIILSCRHQMQVFYQALGSVVNSLHELPTHENGLFPDYTLLVK